MTEEKNNYSNNIFPKVIAYDNGEDYPAIDEFLKSIGITKCLIEYI